jgi:integrase
VRLTAKSVEAARAADVRREIGDDYMRGLYLVIQPHTGTKSWAVRYRLHGKPTKHTIGSYPAFNLGQAREAAAKVLRGVSEGRGPEATKIETIAQGVEQFIARHCKHYRPKSLREATTQLARYVVEPWGARRLGSINRSDVRHILDGISAPILANRVHSVVSTFFKWCVENDLISISPAAGIRRPHKEKSRDRVLTDSDLGQAWRSANGFYGQIIRLLILTGQRRGEVSGMCWNELDLDQATWTLPPERTKNGRRHEIPLSKQALAIIRGLPRISEQYVFSVDGVRPS